MFPSSQVASARAKRLKCVEISDFQLGLACTLEYIVKES